MHKIIALLLLVSGAFATLPSCTKPIPSIDTALVPKVIYVDQNDNEAYDCINEQGDTLRNILAALGGTTGAAGLSSTGDLKAVIDRDSNTTGSIFWVANHTNDSLFRVKDDSTAKFFGNLTVAGTTTQTGVTTFTAAPILSALTASLPVFTNGSKALASNAMTGTGSVVMSASPTLTGTLAAAGGTYSGTLGVTGVAAFTAAPVFSSATASQAMFTDGSKGLVSNAITGTGSVVMSSAPTGTGVWNLTGALIAGDSLRSNGSISISNAQASQFMVSTTASNPALIRFTANGAIGYLAKEGTSGTDFMTSGTAGALQLATATNVPVQIGVNGAKVADFTAAATSLTGTLGVTGLATLSGSANIGTGTSNVYARLNGAAATTRELGFNTNNVTRWIVEANNDAESGSNAGSNFELIAYTDAGAEIDRPITISRAAAGIFAIKRPVTMSSTLAITGVATFTAAPVFSSATASTAAAFDGSKNLVSATITGSGNAVYSASPTLTGTVAGASSTWSGTLGVTGVGTFTAAPVFSSVTASQILSVDGSKSLTSTATTGSGSVALATSPTLTTPTVATSLTASYATVSTAAEFDGSKNLVSVTKTGTGNDVYSASPTLTGTLTAATITASGNVTADSLISSKFYTEGSWTATYTGFSSLSATAKYIRIGKQVTLLLPSATGTSNSTSYTISNLPAAIAPATAQWVPLDLNVFQNNSTLQTASDLVEVRVDAGTTITFLRAGSSTGWTASGTKGLTASIPITYTLY